MLTGYKTDSGLAIGAFLILLTEAQTALTSGTIAPEQYSKAIPALLVLFGAAHRIFRTLTTKAAQ